MADRSTFVADTEPFMRPLYSTAVRLTTNRSDAEDLVQETYLRAYRSYGTFQPGSNVRAWLFRILANAHINRYRARARRPEETALDDVDELAGRPGGFEAGPSAEDELLAALSEADAIALVDQLDPPYRQTVLLADVRGLSYAEIAASLDIPIGTVMSRLHRGRRILRRRAVRQGHRPAALVEPPAGPRLTGPASGRAGSGSENRSPVGPTKNPVG